MTKVPTRGAPHGTGHWIQQRMSAVLIALYTVIFLIALAADRPADFDSWRAFFAPGWFRLATVTCFVALLYHAWIGMRDILMDYVKSYGLRLALYTLIAVLLFSYAIWSIRILWSI